MASMEAILDEGVHLVCLRHDEGRARTSVFNVQRSTFKVCGGLGAPHMNQALSKKLWDRLGLVLMLGTITGLTA